ncbi:MAG: winged helix-turn-helix transcriptional regulator [Chloroflexi bacterium]|nr:MAG: winged helix-turn-helix transcriptional regulator [Chloroflexota bacterium]TMD50991.1 MAG: winged helix-turn-helix transcriptional regulator [Chloroflexota bacterium]
MPEDRLSIVLAALADPTRRAILSRLEKGEATVLELAAPFELKLPTVSKHLKVLQRAGLISQGRKAQWRPCRLEPAALKDVSDWVERYRHTWEERHDQLQELLRQLQAGRDEGSRAEGEKP